MLTKLTIKNFKRFEDAEVDLGKSVVLIGPNNSGKTTALQALALWELGLRRWTEKRQGKPTALQRQGVAINRRDLVALPVPTANLLWRDLHVRNLERREGKQKTQNIRVDILVEGISDDRAWTCGLEFDYANEESFYCRPLRLDDASQPERMAIPELATRVKVALLPPMSGLTDREFIKQPGEIGVLIGQGQTAQVLRNLCYRVCWPGEENTRPSNDWVEVAEQLSRLFGVKLLNPKFIAERSEIVMQYEEKSGARLDISSSGRGLQQTLLILAHLYANPRTVLLLDEPDAHLEVLRQRQTYQLINDLADTKGSQIIAASHSEVVLAEAANRGMVVAFVGKPHLLNDRGSQVMKALTDLGWDQYYQAEETGWVLYVEDSTDLAVLKAFARILGHPAQDCLEMPFVHYVTTNLPQKSRDHFNGLREAKSDLVGIAIFDRLDRTLQPNENLNEVMWAKREIENYFCAQEVLYAWAVHDVADDLFGVTDRTIRQQAMEKAIAEVTHLLEIDEKSPWSSDVKATDEVFDRVFRLFFKEIGLPLSFRKRDYHLLAGFLSKHQIDQEVVEKLDAIVAVAKRAKPVVL
ncbi:ATP-binding protein [Propionivibrio sp.]|uniref:ATP-dependent nuclease n=1 Tax=Propionivibrio sp. TaxID=2212460 RepID=UPI0026192BDD|nr:ATP-binding protein [Propionivibrio sp.]